MQVSSKFNGLLERLEGFRSKPYQDTGGVWTIGFGHAIKKGEHFTEITREEALALLNEDTVFAQNAVNNHVTVPLEQHQFDALVSFVYNVGERAFKGSNLLKCLNKGCKEQVPTELRRWRFDNGHPVPGLSRRREAEIDTFMGKA